MTGAPRIVSLGDSALLVEYEARIDVDVNRRAVAFARAIVDAAFDGVSDVVPAYRSVAVYYDRLRTDLQRLRKFVEETARLPVESSDQGVARTIRVPVCYGGEDGPDLEAVAAFAQITEEEAVARHLASAYRVFMLGFTPGFPYMGLVDESIAMPRRTTPRTRVPAGSVGIAARQTGIYPTASPGGWQLIGRTPLRLFDLQRTQPATFAPGDRVQFFRIDRAEWDRFA